MPRYDTAQGLWVGFARNLADRFMTFKSGDLMVLTDPDDNDKYVQFVLQPDNSLQGRMRWAA